MNKVKDLTVDELKQIIREIIREEISYKVIPNYESCPTPLPLQVGEPYHRGIQITCDSSNINKGDING